MHVLVMMYRHVHTPDMSLPVEVTLLDTGWYSCHVLSNGQLLLHWWDRSSSRTAARVLLEMVYELDRGLPPGE